MPLRLEPRPLPSALLNLAVPPLAVAATVAVSGLLFALLGYPALATLQAFFVAPLTSLNGWAELALKAGPLAMIAAGLAAGFRANVWNIGAQGQLTAGAIAGGGVALALPDAQGAWVLPLVCGCGVAGGMAWGAIPAFLRTRLGVNEILTSLMLTYVASLALSALVFGPWKDPQGYSLPQSPMFSDAATLMPLVPRTRLTAGTLIEFLVPVVLWLILRSTLLGFKIRTAGAAPEAAGYAGFVQSRVVWTVLMIGSGLAGLAGVFEVAGPIGQLIPQITPGYGFTAIIAAFLGRLHPLGIIPAALLLALSFIGGDTAQVRVGLPSGAAGMVQGMLLFFPLAADFLVRNRLRWHA
jgi:simple sugar transport system permease protein